MTTVLTVFHLFVAVALIGIVLIQRSEGGGLGIGSSQGMGGLMSGRGTANLLTRTTAVLAVLFMGLALALALLDRGASNGGRNLLELPSVAAPASPAPASPAPASPAPASPAGAASPVAPAKPAPPHAPTN